jgi:hypothetical protein
MVTIETLDLDKKEITGTYENTPHGRRMLEIVLAAIVSKNFDTASYFSRTPDANFKEWWSLNVGEEVEGSEKRRTFHYKHPE